MAGGRSSLRRRAAVAVLCAAWGSAALAADPQARSMGTGNYFTEKPAGSVDYKISDKPFIIAAQVRRAYMREKTAVDMLSKVSDLQSLTAIQEVVHDGYVLLRTATHGIEQAQSNSRYPNPMLALRIEKIMGVRHHLLLSLNGMQNAQKWSEPSFLTDATENLETAIRLLEALMPRML
jgi:hypothetical protein